MTTILSITKNVHENLLTSVNQVWLHCVKTCPVEKPRNPEMLSQPRMEKRSRSGTYSNIANVLCSVCELDALLLHKQVDNTDAEGRLILADALCYGHTFNPRAIVNVATLTGGEKTSGEVFLHGHHGRFNADIHFGLTCCQGAMDVALGSAATGVFTNSDWLWEQLHKVSRQHRDHMSLSLSSRVDDWCVCVRTGWCCDR